MKFRRIVSIVFMVVCVGIGLLIGISTSGEPVEYVEVPCENRQFESYSELINWLELDDTDAQEYIVDEFDCEDFAMMLQRNALEDGYIISIELVDLDGDGFMDHAMNTAVIGNNIWLIEPQTDSVWLYAFCD